MVYNPTVGIEEDNVSDAGARVGRDGHVGKGGCLKFHINMDISANTSFILILESSELMVMKLVNPSLVHNNDSGPVPPPTMYYTG